MNILFYVGGYSFYGSERKLLTIMKGLKEKGHNVHCITNGWSDGVFNQILKDNSIPFSTSKLGFIYFKKLLWTLDTLVHYPVAILHYIKLRNRHKPHFVYHNYYRSILMLAPFVSAKRNIYHVGDISDVSYKNKLIFKCVQYKCHLIIASSYFVRQNLLELGIKENMIKVVMNGIEPFQSFTKVSSDKIQVGIVGQIIPRKGHVDLIEAIHLLSKSAIFKIHKFVCLIYGSGDESFIASLKKRIEEYHLTSVIYFKGYQKEKIEIYRNLDMVVVPSHYEAFGFSAVEPAFCKIPVIASDTGGLKEIIDDGKTGFLFEPQNVKDLANKLEILLTDLSKIEDMGIAAFHRANRFFTSIRMINEIEEILQTEHK